MDGHGGNLGKHEVWRKGASVDGQEQIALEEEREKGNRKGNKITIVLWNARRAYQKTPWIGGKYHKTAVQIGMCRG